ncbi:wax ester/triacylglycerol synthase family O-acyltransferase [Pseudomonas sp. PCH199]|uniref:wax ester/triacylglycerol synthase family O-acyltransferase n=1 Tax=unclassified Pseudomonas TaxID=196821 RepID=UPI000BC97216|nr:MULTISPECIES: wax ester/triacylglycerol synthase family O-acyltransferase [unclassified Pseudomonas]MCW8277287.1 wax ester/triacylglycerol synthase family O-acyltransferase [Pseudomonas sp. PCH199]PAM82499.1 wax ester/triacylglycerol synthase family O-acyltransferase [Pseudomonas sp. ERMR1:02]
MSKLSGQDALFLNVDRPHAASHCTMIYIYDQSTVEGQRLGFREIVRHISDRLDVSPVFKRKIIQVPFSLGYPYWVEDDLFDIDFHVRHFALPKPGDWRQFCIQVSRIHARSMDLARAPWEMYVIEGLDNIEGIPKGSFAILTKTHHAAMDGAAAAELTWALHDLAGAQGKPVAVVDNKPAASSPPRWGMLDTVSRMFTDNISASARMALPLARVLPKLTVASLRKVACSVLGSEGGAPRTRFNSNVVSGRVWDSVTLDLAVVKQIKSLVPGATVNDAVLAMVGGAMRRYLIAKDELPEKSLMTLAPVNTRQGNESVAAGNTVSMLTFPLRTDIEDPVARLQALQAATSQSKAIQNAVGASDLTNLQKFAPPATLGLAGRLATLMGMGGKGPVVLHNCMVTNVPGPNVPLYMLGAKLVYWCGVGPLVDGLSLIWNPTSYCEKMFISLTSSPNVVPDPDFLAQCLKDSYEEMKAVATQAAQTETPKTPKARRVARKSASPTVDKDQAL